MSDYLRSLITTYLEKQGGGVSADNGIGLTNDMARRLGYTQTATELRLMEDEALILRDMNGKRTYSIKLKPKRGRPAKKATANSAAKPRTNSQLTAKPRTNSQLTAKMPAGRRVRTR